MDDWSNLSTDTDALMELNCLMYYYASEVYGRQDFRSWLKAHPDKTLPDRLTASDIAFALLVYENYYVKWVHELETQREEERQKGQTTMFAAAAADDTVNNEPRTKKRKKMYSGPTLTYTKPGNTKLRYLEHNWNKEGVDRFQVLHLSFTELLKTNVDTWDLCKESFVEYISNMKRIGEGCWVEQYYSLEGDDATGNSEDYLGATEGFEFMLDEDNDDFVHVALPPMSLLS